jgi:membrane protein DedA with SNARE-associated domain
MTARRHRTALSAAAAGAVLVLALTLTGTIQLPSLEHALTDLADTLGAWTYLLVGGLAFLETGAFVGLVAPGETAIVLGGVVAAEGGVDLVPVLLIAWGAAALGDLASFMLGQRLGRRFMLTHGPRVGITAPRLERVERFYDRHGAKAIFVGRFVGLVRAVSPFLAGSSGLRLRAFLPWSLLGTAVWASAYTLAGYAFHRSFSEAAGLMTKGALALAVVAALVLAWRAHRRAALAHS